MDDILMKLQKCIDFNTSDLYVFQAYFMRIYILIFKIKNYYAAQYEIDMLTVNIQNRKFSKKKEKIHTNISVKGIENLNTDESSSAN